MKLCCNKEQEGTGIHHPKMEEIISSPKRKNKQAQQAIAASGFCIKALMLKLSLACILDSVASIVYGKSNAVPEWQASVCSFMRPALKLRQYEDKRRADLPTQCSLHPLALL